MCDLTFVSRANDGLLLVETWDDSSSRREMQILKQQAKQLLRKLDPTPLRCSIESKEAYTFHYMLSDGVCFMTICASSYPKKLAFAFLDEVAKAFLEELKREFGTHSVDYRSMIETIEKPYYFIKFVGQINQCIKKRETVSFPLAVLRRASIEGNWVTHEHVSDRIIQKKKLEYRDSRSTKALLKLNDSLTEVSSIMKKNIDDILNRGENLEDVGRKANDLKYASEKFKGVAKVLSYQAWLQQYAPVLVVGVIILLVIVWRFFL